MGLREDIVEYIKSVYEKRGSEADPESHLFKLLLLRTKTTDLTRSKLF
jgi:hypothetical protein